METKYLRRVNKDLIFGGRKRSNPKFHFILDDKIVDKLIVPHCPTETCLKCLVLFNHHRRSLEWTTMHRIPPHAFCYIS